MIYRNYEIEINDYTSKIYYVKEIQYYQNDINTCRLLVNVYDKSSRCDLTNTTIRFCVQLPINDTTTGKPITFQQQYGINLIDAEKGIFEIILDNELIKNVGKHIADIQVYDKDNQNIRFSSRIEYTIVKSTFDEATAQTTNEFSLLQDLVAQCQKALEQLGNITDIDFDALIKQIDEIKKAIADLGDITNLITDVDNLKATTGTLTTDVTTIKAQISTMQSEIDNIKANAVSKAYVDGELLKKANTSDIWSPVNKVVLESTQQVFTTLLKDKIDGIEVGANKYVHPNDTNTRHVTDTQIATWDSKIDESALNIKADKSYVDAELLNKASKSELDNKADVVHSQGAGSVLFTDGQTLQYKYNNGQLGGGGSGGTSADLTQVDTNILPKLPNLNIGSPTQRFKNIYVDEAHLSTNTLYIGNTPVLGTDNGTVVVKADPNQSVRVVTDGNSSTDIASNGITGKVNIYGTQQVNIQSTDINMTGNTNVDNLTVKGNLNVQGTTTTINSTNISVKDNILEINKGEVGNGVSLGQAGIKIDRGDSDDYFMLFDEGTDTFKVGTQSTMQTVATVNQIPNVANKLESTNIKAGANVTISTSGNDVTISAVSSGGTGNADWTTTTNKPFNTVDTNTLDTTGNVLKVKDGVYAKATDIPNITGKADKTYVDTELSKKAETATVNVSLGTKVDKVTGKQLTTEDYTTAEKTKLSGISASAKKVESSLTNGNVKIDGVETKVYTHPTTHTSSEITGLSTVATSGAYTDLSNTPSIPSKTSQLTNDSNFATVSQIPDVTGKADKSYVDAELLKKADKTTTYTKTEVDGLIPNVSAKADKTYVDTELAKKSDVTTVTTGLATKVDKVTGKGLSTEDYTTAEKTKLSGVATGANNYTHPSTHSASIIVQDNNNRFVSDSEKATWNGKVEKSYVDTQDKTLDDKITVLSDKIPSGTIATTEKVEILFTPRPEHIITMQKCYRVNECIYVHMQIERIDGGDIVNGAILCDNPSRKSGVSLPSSGMITGGTPRKLTNIYTTGSGLYCICETGTKRVVIGGVLLL